MLERLILDRFVFGADERLKDCFGREGFETRDAPLGDFVRFDRFKRVFSERDDFFTADFLFAERVSLDALPFRRFCVKLRSPLSRSARLF